MVISWIHLKYIGAIIAISVAFGIVILNMVNAGVYWANTGDSRPFIESSVGQMLSTDTQIYKDVSRVVQYGDDTEADFVELIKQRIITNVLLMFFFWYLLFLIIYKVFGLFMSKATENTGIVIMLVLFSLVIIIAANIIYTGAFLDEWGLPGKGIRALVSNFGTVFDTTGFLENLGTIGKNATQAATENVTQGINNSV